MNNKSYFYSLVILCGISGSLLIKDLFNYQEKISFIIGYSAVFFFCFCLIIIHKKKECKHDNKSLCGLGTIIPGTKIYRFPIQCIKCKEYFFMEIDNEKQTTKFYSIDKEVLDL